VWIEAILIKKMNSLGRDKASPRIGCVRIINGKKIRESCDQVEKRYDDQADDSQAVAPKPPPGQA
jgi:hypothetical protein